MKWLRSWWQQIKKHRVAIGVGIVLVGGIVLGFAVAWFNGTGFDGYNQVTTAHTISGPSAGTVVRTEVYQPGKALWDWLQLAIIPAAIAFGVLWFSRLQQQRDQQLADQRTQVEREAAEKRAEAEREAAEKQAQTERDVALDNQREAALQDYIDNMSKLLLENNLGDSGKNDKVRKVARVRTLTVLPRLNGDRKASVVQFLYESGLIYKDKKIIDLDGADLSGADLSIKVWIGADLSGSYLRGANLEFSTLTEVNLSFAYLDKANLSFATLNKANMYLARLDEANLSGADLQEANLDGVSLFRAYMYGAKVTTEQLNKAVSLEGATMPDGTEHAYR